MSKGLCDCPVVLGLGRKCGCLATPLIIRKVNENLAKPLDEICDWVVKCATWRDQQQEEFTKGVKPENVQVFIDRVNGCRKTGKAALCDLLENTANRYHEVIRSNQQQELENQLSQIDDSDLYDYPEF